MGYRRGNGTRQEIAEQGSGAQERRDEQAPPDSGLAWGQHDCEDVRLTAGSSHTDAGNSIRAIGNGQILPGSGSEFLKCSMVQCEICGRDIPAGIVEERRPNTESAGDVLQSLRECLRSVMFVRRCGLLGGEQQNPMAKVAPVRQQRCR
jgi:hypothetical protein